MTAMNVIATTVTRTLGLVLIAAPVIVTGAVT